MLAAIVEAAKPRILFLLTTSDWGGVQFFVHATAVEAKRRGYAVMVAAGGSGELGPRCEASGIRFARLLTMRRDISPFHDLAALHEVRRIIRDFKPDAVHLNSSKMGVLGSVAAELERVPRVVYRIGGWSFLERISPMKQWMYRMAEKWSASKKDIIVTVHPGDEGVARREAIVPRGRLVTIPNGIDLARFDRELLTRDDARRALGLAPSDVVVGTLANYYPPKALPAYLETIAALPFRVVIIGDGPERDAIRQKHRELNLGERVMLAGRRDDASTLLKAFDLFVLPSSKEGMPWALLEAMAARLPCIATDVGACRWMLEPDAGVIVPPDDPKALRDAIAAHASDAETRNRLGEAARRAVESRFRWETTLEKTLELFG